MTRNSMALYDAAFLAFQSTMLQNRTVLGSCNTAQRKEGHLLGTIQPGTSVDNSKDIIQGVILRISWDGYIGISSIFQRYMIGISLISSIDIIYIYTLW
jgi:hypothetical protein